MQKYDKFLVLLHYTTLILNLIPQQLPISTIGAYYPDILLITTQIDIPSVFRLYDI